MKTFLATFAAILCAAAVIYAANVKISDRNALAAAEEQQDRELLGLTMGAAHRGRDCAVAQAFPSGMEHTETTLLFSSISAMRSIWEHGHIAHADLAPALAEFLASERRLTAYERTKGAEETKWADEQDAAMADLERLAAR